MWTLKAHTSSASSPTTAIDTTGADLIVVGLVWYQVGGAPNLTDSYGNVWTELSRFEAGSGVGCTLYYCQGPTVGAGHTFSSSASVPSLFVEAWSGSVVTPSDVQNGATGTTTDTSIQTGSVTPGSNGELVVSLVGAYESSGVFSVDSSMTISDQQAPGTWGGALAYLIQSTAAAVNPTWTVPAASGYGVAAAIATFKGSGGGGRLLLHPGMSGRMQDLTGYING